MSTRLDYEIKNMQIYVLSFRIFHITILKVCMLCTVGRHFYIHVEYGQGGKQNGISWEVVIREFQKDEKVENGALEHVHVCCVDICRDDFSCPFQLREFIIL